MVQMESLWCVWVDLAGVPAEVRFRREGPACFCLPARLRTGFADPSGLESSYSRR